MSEQVNANPWVVQEAKQFVPLPIGFYNGVFKGVEEVTMKDGKPKWRFSWEAQSGEHKGKMASALCDRSITSNALPGRLISGLLGRAVLPGENVKDAIEACVGKAYMVGVQPGPKGGKPGVQSCGSPPAM